MTEQLMTEGVSRRTALKRLGAGTAVVWAAPSLLSLGARAHAQGSAACATPTCEDLGVCPDNPGCVCAPLHGGGGSVCWTGLGLCSGSADNICETDADCDVYGTGYRCAEQACPTICGTSTTFCAPPCGTTQTAASFAAVG